MENVIAQFGNNYYSQKTGIITGDNDSVSVANIAMRYVMKTAEHALSKCHIVKRFIDDIIMHYTGSLESAESIKKVLSEAFAKEGLILTFRHIRSDDSSNIVVEIYGCQPHIGP